MSLPFPDQIALKMVAFVPGTVSTSNILFTSQGVRQRRNGGKGNYASLINENK